MALEAMNAKTTVKQLVAAKEAEAKAKAELAVSEAAEAEGGYVVVSAAPKQPTDAPAVPAKVVEAPAGGVKRPSGDASASSSKRARRRKPELLGTRDG